MRILRLVVLLAALAATTALLLMLPELDECDLSSLCREAQEMVKTNRELTGEVPSEETRSRDIALSEPSTNEHDLF